METAQPEPYVQSVQNVDKSSAVNICYWNSWTNTVQWLNHKIVSLSTLSTKIRKYNLIFDRFLEIVLSKMSYILFFSLNLYKSRLKIKQKNCFGFTLPKRSMQSNQLCCAQKFAYTGFLSTILRKYAHANIRQTLPPKETY